MLDLTPTVAPEIKGRKTSTINQHMKLRSLIRGAEDQPLVPIFCEGIFTKENGEKYFIARKKWDRELYPFRLWAFAE